VSSLRAEGILNLAFSSPLSWMHCDRRIDIILTVN
jgi:hypothetical protein